MTQFELWYNFTQCLFNLFDTPSPLCFWYIGGHLWLPKIYKIFLTIEYLYIVFPRPGMFFPWYLACWPLLKIHYWIKFESFKYPSLANITYINRQVKKKMNREKEVTFSSTHWCIAFVTFCNCFFAYYISSPVDCMCHEGRDFLLFIYIVHLAPSSVHMITQLIKYLWNKREWIY